MNGDKEVTGRTPPQSRFTLARKTNLLAVHHTCGDANGDGTTTGGHTGAVTLRAGILNASSLATTVRTRAGEAEGPLLLLDIPRTVTGGARHRRGSRRCTRTIAVRAWRRVGELQRDSDTLGGLAEIERNLCLHIRTTAGLLPPGSTSATIAVYEAAQEIT